ncbi:MAG: hypothetical protein AAFS07_13310 [Pseudomonadota bacterium]
MKQNFERTWFMDLQIALILILLVNLVTYPFFPSVFAADFYAPPEREGTRTFSLENPALESPVKAQIHDYIGDHGGPGLSADYKTSGRYMAFAIPMKWWYLGNLFDDDPVIQILLHGTWLKDRRDGQGLLRPWHDGGMRSQRESLSHQTAIRITLRASAGGRVLLSEDALVGARDTGVRTPTYRPGGRRDIFWLGETYCGFDVFETGEPRQWTDERGAPADAPHPDIPTRFHTGRLFGYPAGAAAYAFIADCSKVAGDKVQCLSTAPLNDFVDVYVGMDARNLCDAPEMRAQTLKMISDHATLVERE